MSTSPWWKLSICLSSVLAGGTFLDVILNLNQKRSKAIYNSEYLSPPAMWLWLAPAVLLSQGGRQSRNSSIIASCNQGGITWGPITSCANNVLTDAGGLLLLLPANLWLIMLIKLEVNLPFKDAHPTPTEISRRRVQQSWRQPWLSPFVSPAAYKAPPLRPFGFPLGRWYAGQGPAVVLGARDEEQSVKWCFLPHTSGAPRPPSAAFWEMLGQKLHFMFSSPWCSTHFPKNLFGSSSTEMKHLRHSGRAERGQQVDWSNYKDLSAGFVGCLGPRVGSFAQSLSLLWGNAVTTFNGADCALETGQEGGGPFIHLHDKQLLTMMENFEVLPLILELDLYFKLFFPIAGFQMWL